MTNLRWWSLLASLAIVLGTRTGAAHPVGVSRGEYRATAEGLEVSLVFSEQELAPLRPAPSSGGLEQEVLRRVEVSSGSARCPGRVRRVQKRPPDGLELELGFTCAMSDAPRQVELRALFGALARGHRHEVAAGSADPRLLFDDDTHFSVPAPGGGPAPSKSEPAAPHVGSALGFVRMGVEHILTGFDHLVFLLGLVVVGVERRRVLGIVTAFTLAHSLTLAISVLGVWSPPGAIVEPLIALSVAYVGIENFLARSFERRALLAFAFGLVHGFGFAGALAEVRFEGAALSLVAFNGGVELGQLAVLSALLPLIAFVRRSPPLERSVVPAVNTVVVLLGLGWFVLRVA